MLQREAAKELAARGEKFSEEDELQQSEETLLPGGVKPLLRIDDSKVDGELDRAIQALPEELPFQQVDRIEYMNAQLRASSEAGNQGGAAAGGAQATSGGSAAASSRFNLTLVTQADRTRIAHLAECANRWRWPLVATIVLTDGAELRGALGGRRFGRHVTLLPYVAPGLANGTRGAAQPYYSEGPSPTPYPINALRNHAIRHVRTSHFIVLDADVWPSSGLHDAVLSAPEEMLSRKYAALVIPAFQLELSPPRPPRLGIGEEADGLTAAFYEAAFDRVPSSRSELQACIGAKQCTTFYAHSAPETHSSTPYADWWLADAATEPLPIPCFESPRYEPYVVLPNLPSTPLYSEAFNGYGKNKIELITHMRFAGFQFYALPDAFVAHMPHAKSAEKAAWEAPSGREHHRMMDALYQRLVKQLVAKYKAPRTPSCDGGRLL